MASYLIPLLLAMYITIALINALGKDVLVELVPSPSLPVPPLPANPSSTSPVTPLLTFTQTWKLYLLLPLPIRTHLKSQRTLQSTLLTTSATLKSTSAQDDFAKWARLNRQHDKQIQDLQTLTSAIESHKSKFRRGARILLWVGTTGVKGGVQWWFNRAAVFWLPAGTFPYWVEYVLAFPKAPRGTTVLGIVSFYFSVLVCMEVHVS